MGSSYVAISLVGEIGHLDLGDVDCWRGLRVASMAS